MSKVAKISETSIPINFNFTEQDFSRYWDAFEQSELGCIYRSIPWDLFVKTFKIKANKKGRRSIFSPRGKIALMFLKNYTSLSDRKLIENLAANYQYQFFCDIHIRPGDKIPNFKIVSEIRVELASKLDLNQLQKQLAQSWKPYIQNTDCMLQDATCYESSVRYPTDAKLLWESCYWLYVQIKQINRLQKERMPRSKFIEQKNKYLNYSKKRRKTHKQTQKRIKSLLYLLNKLLGQLSDIMNNIKEINLTKNFHKRLKTIKKILEQQQSLFVSEKVSDRIISISKDYLHPIVRGKEIKAVEFGAKANVIQVDGIDFIEHISFSAFNEGTHFQSSVFFVQELFNTKLRVAGADAIYATNANRKFCSNQKILTCFVPKGKRGQHEHNLKQMRKLVNKERATAMEGAFGKHKNHYNLNRINARTEKTEILWIFFGIHTANAVEIGRRIKQSERQQLKLA